MRYIIFLIIVGCSFGSGEGETCQKSSDCSGSLVCKFYSQRNVSVCCPKDEVPWDDGGEMFCKHP